MGILSGKTVVITGGVTGIGRGIATICAREGAIVYVNYREKQAQAEDLAACLWEMYGNPVTPVRFDVRVPEQLESAVAEIVEKQGEIHGWVNNAGINLPGLLPMQSDMMIKDQLETNVTGVINGARAVLPQMMGQRQGVILNIGSIVSTSVAQGQAVYAATKGAIVSFTRAIAKEYGRKGIRANCIEPGPVETGMLQLSMQLAGEDIRQRIPLGRIGLPEDVGEAAAFLLSAKASFITGETIRVDGGYSLGC